MNSSEQNLSTPFDFVTAQTRFKAQAAATTQKPTATRPPAIPLHPEPRYDSESTPTIILREALTIAALAGILWFQYEIIRCFW